MIIDAAIKKTAIKTPSFDWRRPQALLILSAVVGGIGLLWVRSNQHGDVLTFCTSSGNVQGLASVDGSLVLVLSTVSFGQERAMTLHWEANDPALLMGDAEDSDRLPAKDRNRFGFGFTVGVPGINGPDGRWCAVRCPDWCPLSMVGLIWLILVVEKALRRRRRWRGLCGECGYDLRVSSGRCPECGCAV